MKERILYPLEKCMDAIIDYRGKTPCKTNYGIPLITAKVVKDGRILPVTEYIDPASYDTWMRRGIPVKGDVLLTTEAPLGEVAQLDGRKVALAQRVITLRGRDGLLDNTYLKYLLISEYVQMQLFGHATGTTVEGIKQSELRKILLPIPPVPEQKAIAHILGSLDDKIELNRQMNETLEGMARALFKSWFVDFDPVIDNALVAGNPIPDEFADRAEIRRQALADGTANREVAKSFPAAFQQTEAMGWIPEGWKGAKLSDLLEVKYGKDHKKLAEGSIPVYGSGGLMRYADKALYSGESVLIPRKGTLSNILYLNEKFWTVDTMFYTTPKCSYFLKYTFYHLKRLDFASMNVGSAVPSMTTKVLNALPIVMPAESVLHKFDSVLTSYFERAEANNMQSKMLSKLRDTLLPKLISGEVRIEDAEQIVDEQLS
jgi:type I restriction enzyme S subunit